MNIDSDVPSETVYYKIVVPHDLSLRADRAVQMAGTMAHPLRSEVIVIHVVDPNERRPDEAVSFITQLSDLARERWRRLHHAAQRLLPVNVKIDVRVLSGDPQNVILAEARRLGADLLIVTVHPVEGAGYPFDGGTVESLQQKAPCPVLTIPVTEKEEASLVKQQARKMETHSLKQYCDVSRVLSKQGVHRPVYLGYSRLPSNPSGVCE